MELLDELNNVHNVDTPLYFGIEKLSRKYCIRQKETLPKWQGKGKNVLQKDFYKRIQR